MTWASRPPHQAGGSATTPHGDRAGTGRCTSPGGPWLPLWTKSDSGILGGEVAGARASSAGPGQPLRPACRRQRQEEAAVPSEPPSCESRPLFCSQTLKDGAGGLALCGGKATAKRSAPRLEFVVQLSSDTAVERTRRARTAAFVEKEQVWTCAPARRPKPVPCRHLPKRLTSLSWECETLLSGGQAPSPRPLQAPRGWLSRCSIDRKAAAAVKWRASSVWLSCFRSGAWLEGWLSGWTMGLWRGTSRLPTMRTRRTSCSSERASSRRSMNAWDRSGAARGGASCW